MALKTRITELLDIELPIVGAPMALVSGGALAAAVTNAGGLGLIGGGYGDPDWLTEQWAAAGNTRVGGGFITWKLATQPELLDLMLDRDPAAVFLSFGEVAPFAEKVKARGPKLICQVQSVAQARAAAAAGADVIVAQGGEAGGHSGVRATLPLVPAVVDVVGDIPVLAAGGIADGRGLAAALMLGAEGVLLGTALVGSDESLVPDGAKDIIPGASGDDTLKGAVIDIARGFDDWPDPYRIRSLKNPFIESWINDEPAMRADAEAQRARMTAAREVWDFDVVPVIVGEAVDLVHARRPAGDILRQMAEEAEAHLKRGMGFVG